MNILLLFEVMLVVNAMEIDDENSMSSNSSEKQEAENKRVTVIRGPNPFDIFNFGLGVVGGAVGAVGGAVGGAIGGAVGGALETVSSIERAGPPELPQLPSIPQLPLPSIPSIPNPFNPPVQVQPQQNEEIVEEKLGVDEEDINEENTLKELGPQEFCQQKSSSNNSAETVIWDLQNLSIFAQILQNSNITDQDESGTPVTILVPNNSAFKKLDKQIIEDIMEDVEKSNEFVSRHILTEPICCEQISRNSGPFFNNNRKTSLSGQLISMRRSVSGGLYANTAVINKKHCNNVFQNGVILIINKVL